ncbi:Gfo/Idh/MocA family protein [Parvularcula maris]|uniref:Gfo/Idh/MocA family oxidoreductase n=1 Tax=Parvularcula maris TaxID=2965077 RepID=A0A9X2RK61_9PROT|nr:Gfo/Idh/MocA family oxidoreductase [Parvularcula maris]MCQ8185448.1 Gfo/Idh/MocA family oxidoreductase [Parvularcula maris]
MDASAFEEGRKMAEKLRAGVLGAGVFGGYHAGKYAESEQAELVAIFDLDIARAKEGAERHGALGTSDLDAFLGMVDVATVATPATTHYKFARMALERGIHVLVEKPVALGLGRADTLIELAREKGLILQVGHQERYVAEGFGLLGRGKPERIVSRRLNRYSVRAKDVSVVMDLMIHDLDLLAKLTGEGRAEHVEAKGRYEKGPHADRVDAVMTIGGVRAELSASRLEDEPTRDLRLVYPDGEVHLDFLKREISNTTPEPVKAAFEGDDLPPELRDPLSFGTESFLAAVRGRAEPTVTGEDGRRAVALALQVEEALRG